MSQGADIKPNAGFF